MVKVTSVNSPSGLGTIFWLLRTWVQIPYLLFLFTFPVFLDFIFWGINDNGSMIALQAISSSSSLLYST